MKAKNTSDAIDLGTETGNHWASQMAGMGHRELVDFYWQEWLKESGGSVPQACVPIIAPFAMLASQLGAIDEGETFDSFMSGFGRGVADVYEKLAA